MATMKTTTKRMKALPKLTAVQERLLAATVPDGWTVTRGDGMMIGSEVLVNEGPACWVRWAGRVPDPTDEARYLAVRVTVNVAPKPDWYGAKQASSLWSGVSVEGETEFQAVKLDDEPNAHWGWRGWVRTGVDTSSVWMMDRPSDPATHTYRTVAEMLDGETARCVLAAERARTLRPVPGTGFSRQPEWFTQASANLKAGRTVTLTPSGFGTGHHISTRRSSYARRADAKLEQLLGAGALWLTDIDCD